MDLRVYVDGVARIICDLTRTTTVHDIIIALAQYKGQAGRYSLLERAPDGTERTLSPNELTWELLKHPDWSYILKQNSLANGNNQDRKRSKSVDGQKTPVQQPSNVDGPPAVTLLSSSSSSSTTSGHHRTVIPSKIHGFTSYSSINSSEKKKHPSLNHLFPSGNVNSNNNNNNNTINNNEFVSYAVEQKRASRAPIQIIEQDFGIIDNQQDCSIVHHQIPRTRSQYSLAKGEHSAFHVVDQTTIHPQQQQYIALLKILKSQENQVEQQEKELIEKQKEIDYRETTCQQLQIEHEHIFNHQLDKEVEFYKQLNGNYEHLQEQIKRCSTSLEKKNLLQQQIQININQLREEIEDLQSKDNTNKKDIHQYQHDLDRCNFTAHQHDDLIYVLTDRNNDIERMIDQRRQQLNDLENELVQLDEFFLNNLIHPTQQSRLHPSTQSQYNSCPSTTTVDPSTSVRLRFANNTLWKLCPSGIWV